MGNVLSEAKNLSSSTPTITQASKVATDICASASSGVDGSELTTSSTTGNVHDNNNTNNKLSNAGETTQSVPGNDVGETTQSVSGNNVGKTTQSVAGNDAVLGASAASSSTPSDISTKAAAAAAATSPSSTGGSAKKKKKGQKKKTEEPLPSPTNALQGTTSNTKRTSVSLFPVGPCLMGNHYFGPTHELRKKCPGCGINIHVVVAMFWKKRREQL
jgi:hypothetical protein